MLRFFFIGFLTFLSFVTARVNADDQGNEFFESRIRPILVERCQECHGETKQWSGLRLDSLESLLRGGDMGPSIDKQHPNASLLLKAVRREGGLEMPPDNPLPLEQVGDIERWINMGAPWPKSTKNQDANAWKQHWAFQPVKTSIPPQAIDHEWVSSPVDSFIADKLQQISLTASPQADRRTILRRLSFGLTGLPPSNEDITAFENDSSPDAYEKWVDRYLASPTYGEHFARIWLDLARYSDSKGYVYGREERMFVHAARYRDWVVQAFNQDLSYDDFLRRQIAADQDTSSAPEDLAAMGFLTLGRRFLGVSHDIIDDRIDVVTRTTMGLTVACARCHDHKYDPIPTTDYYSLYGVFRNSTDRQVDLQQANSLSTQTDDFHKELQNRIDKLTQKTLQSRKTASDRVRSRIADYLFAQTELHRYPEEGFDQVLSVTDIIPSFVRRWENYLSTTNGKDDPVFGAWVRFASLSKEDFELQSRTVSKELQSSTTIHPWVTKRFDQPPSDLREVANRYGALFLEVDQKAKQFESEVSSASTDAEGWKTQFKPFLDVLFAATGPCEVPDEEIISTETLFDSDTCTELWKLQGEVDRWRLQAPDPPSIAVALVDRATMTEPRVFKRGNPANKGALVTRHFLSLFDETAKPFQHGSGRWELANAIASKENHLTARVWVNRLWQHHFGEGFVRTPSDFGLRAEIPSHPELLDWFAERLVESGWSTKRLHRTIVLSAAYQQSSKTRREEDQRIALNVDPENRMIWRFTPHRLRFEELRDTLLHVSDGIPSTVGGKSSDMFATNDSHHRRSLYGFVDRQFLAGTLRVFDFANPDLHIGRRSETMIPQQALFFLNHPFLANRARRVVQRIGVRETEPTLDADIARLYQTVLQRSPSESEMQLARDFLNEPGDELPPPSKESKAWSYGFGEINDESNRVVTFQPLPHFTGSAWQGGTNFPDTALGWVQLTAQGGHPGNDPKHVIIRRWTAPYSAIVSIESTAKHEPDVADGVRFRVISSRIGLLATERLKARTAPIRIEMLEVQAGDTIDFAVDILSELNSDQFLWAPTIKVLSAVPDEQPKNWEALRDFDGPPARRLTRWEQLAQTLLSTNEFLFVD